MGRKKHVSRKFSTVFSPTKLRRCESLAFLKTFLRHAFILKFIQRNQFNRDHHFWRLSLRLSLKVELGVLRSYNWYMLLFKFMKTFPEWFVTLFPSIHIREQETLRAKQKVYPFISIKFSFATSYSVFNNNVNYKGG